MIAEKTDKPWFLYIIKMANGNLYTGITLDITRRFDEHQHSKKGAKALKGKGPLTLLLCIEMCSKSTALKTEYWVKQQTRAQKLRLIRGLEKIPFEHRIIDNNDLQIQPTLTCK